MILTDQGIPGESYDPLLISLVKSTSISVDVSWFHLSPKGGRERLRDINDTQVCPITRYDFPVKSDVLRPPGWRSG